MANTYIPIATVTVGAGGATNIDFTSIPQTYTDLSLFVSSRSTFTVNPQAALYISFNGNSSSSNYSQKRLEGDGASVNSYSTTTAVALWGTVPANSATANTFGNSLFYMPNYATTAYKSISADGMGENNVTNAYSALTSILIADTTPISAIKLATDGNFTQYSTATLYGISKS